MTQRRGLDSWLDRVRSVIREREQLQPEPPAPPISERMDIRSAIGRRATAPRTLGSSQLRPVERDSDGLVEMAENLAAQVHQAFHANELVRDPGRASAAAAEILQRAHDDRIDALTYSMGYSTGGRRSGRTTRARERTPPHPNAFTPFMVEDDPENSAIIDPAAPAEATRRTRRVEPVRFHIPRLRMDTVIHHIEDGGVLESAVDLRGYRCSVCRHVWDSGEFHAFRNLSQAGLVECPVPNEWHAGGCRVVTGRDRPEYPRFETSFALVHEHDGGILNRDHRSCHYQCSSCGSRWSDRAMVEADRVEDLGIERRRVPIDPGAGPPLHPNCRSEFSPDGLNSLEEVRRAREQIYGMIEESAEVHHELRHPNGVSVNHKIRRPNVDAPERPKKLDDAPTFLPPYRAI